jgi:beta-galactosidase
MKSFIKVLTLQVFLFLFALNPVSASRPGDFTVGQGTFLLNGKPFVVKAAELHYPRIPQPYWEHRIKMCKALGMNTVCLYVFWNIHEPQEGQFDFSGNNDVAAFCRLAQKNGMYVIVRPGPYVCAEWEMGGLPWWLLKKKDIRLREQDSYFMEHVAIFEKKVAEQLAPLTIQRGGPIIMVQVENEYGSYGENKPYVAAIRDMLKENWFVDGKGPVLFQCDWSSNFTKNGLDDLVWTMNFGTGANIDEQFKRLGELRPNAPKMCSEFWSGWFDKWGARHETRPAKDMVEGIDEMLSKGISFSLYMTHGGTSWGHWAGANSPGFAPDVTSYDYDAPINEYGQATPKYYELRKTLEKYNNGKKLPAVPKPTAPLVSFPKVKLQEVTSLSHFVSRTVKSRDTKTFEEMDLGWGSAFYSTTLPQIDQPSTLTINDAHDYAQVFVNGEFIGKVDRVKNEKSITLPPVKAGDQLTILVEAMGRINFGRAIKDFKGITKGVGIATTAGQHELYYDLKDWQIALVPDDPSYLGERLKQGGNLKQSPLDVKNGNKVPGIYTGTFYLKKVGDTFIDMENFGKGQLYVNGHALGRFWRIGPQQTLYCPGCWLKKGRNEVMVLDVEGTGNPVLWGQDHPELDKLQLEKSAKHNNIGDKPDLNSRTPVLTATAASGNGWQTFSFNQPAKGRYLAIEVEGTQQDDAAAIAELYLKDADNKRLARDKWQTKYATSESLMGNHTGDKAFDLQESTYWQTEKGASLPHLLVIDLGEEATVTALEYLPRAEQGAPGNIGKFKVFIY